jgi:hypothetical protein
MERDKVIFRVDKGTNEVFALFPEMPANDMGRRCRSTRGPADIAQCMKASRPAESAEYEELAEELTEQGYNLVIVKRETRAMRELRRLCVEMDTVRLEGEETRFKPFGYTGKCHAGLREEVTPTTIFLNDVHGGASQLRATAKFKTDGILLSVDNRLVAVLENMEGKPQLVVYADANRDEPTDVIPLRGSTT